MAATREDAERSKGVLNVPVIYLFLEESAVKLNNKLLRRLLLFAFHKDLSKIPLVFLSEKSEGAMGRCIFCGFPLGRKVLYCTETCKVIDEVLKEKEPIHWFQREEKKEHPA